MLSNINRTYLEEIIGKMNKGDDIFVVQLTGRMHFGAARAFSSFDRLAALLTDFRVPRSLFNIARFSDTLSHYCIDLPDRKVRGNPLVGLTYRSDLKRFPRHSAWPHIKASESLAAQALHIADRVDFSTIYSFDIQALETFSEFSKHGKRLILEQCVAPRRTQIELIDQFAIDKSDKVYQFNRSQLNVLACREELEWQMADKIICPSSYVKNELCRFGVPENKIYVVPYGFTSNNTEIENISITDNSEKTRAIFVGSIDQRKGLQDLIPVVQKMNGKITLDVYGKAHGDDILGIAQSYVNYHGKLPFLQLEEAYKRADVFVLPSYLEGSATVVYEAMSFGLPCVVTHETGSVVRDEVDGFIIRAGDIDALADRLQRLASDPNLRVRMGRAAMERSKEFTLSKYAERLNGAI
jgi:glycosyltransferase involved in cell wall biosynthesis